MSGIVFVEEKIFLKSEHEKAGVESWLRIWKKTAVWVELIDGGNAWILRGAWVGGEPVDDDVAVGGSPVDEDVAVGGGAVAPVIVRPAGVTGIERAVVDAARQMIAGDVRADHCWAWANAVYTRAGAKPKQVWPTDRYVYFTPSRNIKSLPSFSEAENRERLKWIRPGDWLFINNRNHSDQNGNHSVIFLEWKSTSEANVAQLPRGRTRRPSIASYDLIDMPLAHLSHPVP